MFKRTLEYIATGGQSERLRDVRFEHRKRTNELNQLFEQCRAAEASFKLSLGQLGERKQNLHRGLRKASNLLRHASQQDVAVIRHQTPMNLLAEVERFQRDHSLGMPHRPLAFPICTVIDASVDQFNLALSAAKGSTVGAAVGVGSWGLVSAFGTASTGTAIGTLGGIAAHNAALAWFGGGALAAGGGGMAAGTLVFGGMIAIPALIVTIGLGYRKTKKQVQAFEKACAELYENIDRCTEYLMSIDSATQRAKSISAELDQNGRAFFSDFRTLHRKVHAVFFLSAIWRWFRRVFTGRYFRDEEIADILSVCQTAMNVIIKIDTPIFDTESSPTTSTASAASLH